MDFLDLCRDLNIEFLTEGNHHCRHGWAQLKECCFCGSFNYHLGYCLRTGSLSCYKCGPHGLLQTLVAITGKSFQQCKQLVSELDVLQAKQLGYQTARGKLVLPLGLAPMTSIHRNYLRGRKFNPAHLEKLWQVQGIGLAPKRSFSIFIPIHDEDGEMVSFTTRYCVSDDKADPSRKRYDAARSDEEIINHKQLLYGEHYARHAISIHEGPFNVWAVGPGAVCTFGINFTTGQLVRMAKFPVRVVCFDNEPVAQKRAKVLADKLQVFPGKTFVVTLESGKGADDCNPQEIQNFRRRFLE